MDAGWRIPQEHETGLEHDGNTTQWPHRNIRRDACNNSGTFRRRAIVSPAAAGLRTCPSPSSAMPKTGAFVPE